MSFSNLMCIHSYDEFLNILSQPHDTVYSKFIDKHKNEKLWFRGQASHKWHLLPSLYRSIDEEAKGNWSSVAWDNLKLKEKLRLKLFRVRNSHLMNSDKPANDYLWMCNMQHYQIKTRLLDWSEKADVAFYFAIYFYFLERKKWKNFIGPSGDKRSFVNFGLPSVWVLLPKMLMHNKITEHLPTWDKEYIQDIYNEKNSKFDQLPPTPIIAPYNNDRIKVQAGTFVIFPLQNSTKNGAIIFNGTPYLDTLNDSTEYLFQFVILHPEKCKKIIRDIGLRLSLLYPEMPIIDEEIEEDITDFGGRI